MKYVKLNHIEHGDALDRLRDLPDESIHCCVTSPPYWGLRDYGVDGQLGLEKTPDEYVAKMVEIFREVRRILRKDGTLWLNLGDSYSGGAGGRGDSDFIGPHGKTSRKHNGSRIKRSDGLKPKDLIGIPWSVAFALQADGWWLRQDIIWHKPNPMPESVRDRCTKSHEYIFMLSKSSRYYYDADAIKEPGTESSILRLSQNVDAQAGSTRVPGKTNCNMKAVGKLDKQRGHGRRHAGFNDRWDALSREEQCSLMRNKRSVWTVATAQFKEAHFATFPPDLITPCILAGCPEGGVVLDPFGGSGTTAEVALKTGRKFYLIELSADYIAIAQKRIRHLLEQGVLF